MKGKAEKSSGWRCRAAVRTGAFTWGVLDRLLEDERIEIEAISGASAGAINAAILAHGLTVGGREGARSALSEFWESVASKALFSFAPGDLSSPRQRAPGGRHAGAAIPALLTQVFSPYQLNPLGLNPLRDNPRTADRFRAPESRNAAWNCSSRPPR